MRLTSSRRALFISHTGRLSPSATGAGHRSSTFVTRWFDYAAAGIFTGLQLPAGHLSVPSAHQFCLFLTCVLRPYSLSLSPAGSADTRCGFPERFRPPVVAWIASLQLELGTVAAKQLVGIYRPPLPTSRLVDITAH